MKWYLSAVAIAAAAAMSGCGLQGQINNLKNDRDRQQDEIDLLSERVNFLEVQANLNIESINSMQADIAGQKAEIEALQAALTVNGAHDEETSGNLEAAIAAGVGAYNSMLSVQTALQGQVSSALAQIASLKTNLSISGLVDPCGKSNKGYDEVLIRLSDGRLVAFFEGSDGRRMTVLAAGAYVTTDGDKCKFTVDGSNNLTSQQH